MRLLAAFFLAIFIFSYVARGNAPGPANAVLAAASRARRVASYGPRCAAIRIRQKYLGNAEWDPDEKTGTIRVLDPADYNLRGGDLKLDMECTIVHELCTSRFRPLMRATKPYAKKWSTV
ncbi:MAG: hypothetical protein U0Q18_01495 [Bryobacteraceae bacterium]